MTDLTRSSVTRDNSKHIVVVQIRRKSKQEAIWRAQNRTEQSRGLLRLPVRARRSYATRAETFARYQARLRKQDCAAATTSQAKGRAGKGSKKETNGSHARNVPHRPEPGWLRRLVGAVLRQHHHRRATAPEPPSSQYHVVDKACS